jgi:hypothetical protein
MASNWAARLLVPEQGCARASEQASQRVVLATGLSCCLAVPWVLSVLPWDGDAQNRLHVAESITASILSLFLLKPLCKSIDPGL